jgi:D-beta-D-heptose 7-phosphate kinase/D-beta-D-heptose 1-phosphate adenosyltransferase
MKLNIKSKIFPDFASFEKTLKNWKNKGEKIVFTNGCFDIIHHGHVDSLLQSAEMGTRLVIGLNSDSSVKKLKGKNRPVLDQNGRATVLAAFGFVDAVIIFSEETPADLIARILPDVLVKGSEYKIEEIAGADTVLAHGGEVKSLELVPGISTTGIIEKIKTL